MPELPEVETVRRGLEPTLVGARIARAELRRPDLRFPFPKDFAGRLKGRTVRALGRRAKYLVADLSSGEALIMHLGMSGRFLVERPEGAASAPGTFYHGAGEGVRTHDHVVLHLADGTRITYNDVRRFGFMDLVPGDDLAASCHFARMGIEPLGNELSGTTVAALFRGRRTPLKAALLDQRLIAGLGNIYVCEALFRARLDPAAPAGGLARPDGGPTPAAERLADEIRAVLLEAVEAGGSTLRDYAHPDGASGAFQHRFRVYDRTGEACVAPGCSGVVARTVQAGRSTFACPVCQAPDRAP